MQTTVLAPRHTVYASRLENDASCAKKPSRHPIGYLAVGRLPASCDSRREPPARSTHHPWTSPQEPCDQERARRSPSPIGVRVTIPAGGPDNPITVYERAALRLVGGGPRGALGQ